MRTLGATLPLAGCPICHGATVRGHTFHDTYCPNGVGALKWAPSDVTADDARVMARECVAGCTHDRNDTRHYTNHATD
jgi:hypothetical protein